MKSYLLCLRFLLVFFFFFLSLDWYISSVLQNSQSSVLQVSPLPLLSLQLNDILPSMTFNLIFILLSLYHLFCIFFLIYISIHLLIKSVDNLLLNPDLEFNWGYILVFISRSFTGPFFICQAKFQNFLCLPLILQSTQKCL